MSDNTWAVAPVSNTPADVMPNPSLGTITVAWNGGAVDQDRGELVLPANGGHGDGSDNGVYVCSLRSETPAWSRVWGPSDGAYSADGHGGWNNHAYSDGQPRSHHGWNSPLCYNGTILLSLLSGMAVGAGSSPARYTFDRSAADGWTFRGLALAEPHGSPSSTWNFESSPACYDPVDNRVWVFIAVSNIGWATYSYDASTFETTDYALDYATGIAIVSWVQCVPEDRYLIGADRHNNAIQILDLTNPEAGFTLRTPTGTGKYGNGTYGVYHAPTKAIYVWDSDGSDVYKLSVPADGDWASGAFEWSTIRASAGSISPPAVGNGPYSKFNIIQDMGNGRSALVMITADDAPVYVYKLPAA